MSCEHTAYDGQVHDAETYVRRLIYHEYNERRKTNANNDFVIELS